MAASNSKECCICLDTCTNPVTLPCKHEFCAGCLNGWRCRFTALSLEKRKCPVCRSDLPPTKEMFDQLRLYRADLARVEREASGEPPQSVAQLRGFVEDLESFLEPWDEEHLSQHNPSAGDRGGDPVEMPMRVATAAMRAESIGKVLEWTGHPSSGVDRGRLNAVHDDIRETFLHIAAITENRDLMSVLLQCGLSVNSVNITGYTAFLQKLSGFPVGPSGLESAMMTFRLMLEWGLDYDAGSEDREFVAWGAMEKGLTQLANMIRSDFSGRRCELVNMKTEGMNGRVVLVEKYIASKKRYKIVFEGSGDKALVGSDNLKRRDRTPLDCGYYVEVRRGRVSRRTFETKEECQAYVSSIADRAGTTEATARSMSNLGLSDAPQRKGGGKKKGKKKTRK